MPPRLIDPVVRCEACGEEQPDMVADLRRFRVMNPGKGMKIAVAPLRAPYWCEHCIETVGELIRAARAGAPPREPAIATNGATES